MIGFVTIILLVLKYLRRFEDKGSSTYTEVHYQWQGQHRSCTNRRTDLQQRSCHKSSMPSSCCKYLYKYF